MYVEILAAFCNRAFVRLHYEHNFNFRYFPLHTIDRNGWSEEHCSHSHSALLARRICFTRCDVASCCYVVPVAIDKCNTIVRYRTYKSSYRTHTACIHLEFVDISVGSVRIASIKMDHLTLIYLHLYYASHMSSHVRISRAYGIWTAFRAAPVEWWALSAILNSLLWVAVARIFAA